MNKYKTLASNTAIFAVSTVLSKIVLSLLLPLYTRTLTTSQYGTAELVTSISQLIIPICSLSIQEAVFRFSIEKGVKTDNVLKTSMVVVVASVAGLGASSFLLQYYKAISDWVSYLFVISILSLVRNVFDLYSKSIGNTVIFGVDNIIYNSSLGIFNVILLALNNKGLSGYFDSMVYSNIISIFFLLSFGKIGKHLLKGCIEIQLLKKMILYSAPLIINSISWGITHLTDRVMLTGYCESGATGIYSAASKIPSILSLITGVFCQAWALSAIQDYQEGKDSKFYTNIFFITHFGISVFALGIFVFNNNILLAILGKEFSESIKYVPILIVATVFLTYASFCSPIYSAVKKSKQLMISSFAGMILNVIVNAILIPKYQVMGACVATAASYILIAIIRLIQSKKYIPFDMEFTKWAVAVVLVFTASIFTVEKKLEVLVSVISIIIVCFLYKNRIKSVYKTISAKIRKS